MMKNIIKAEIIKVKGFVPFWIISGVSMGLFVVLVVLMGVFKMDVMFGMESQEVSLKQFMSFPAVWNTTTWLASWFNLFIAALIIILVGNEYRFRTFKQHVIDGFSRNNLLFGKYFVATTIAFTFSLLVFLLSLIFGLVTTEEFSSELFFANMIRVPIYFLQSFAYMSFAIMLVTVFRNTMLSFFIFIAYFILEWLVRTLLFVFKVGEINNFFPMKIITNLTPEPFGVSNLVKTNPTLDNPAISYLLLAVYIALFIGTSFWVINKRDLK